MLQQPRVPPTGQRQAIEVHIKWKEVLNQKQAYLAILSETTGHSVEKLDKVFTSSSALSSALSLVFLVHTIPHSNMSACAFFLMIVSDITAQIGLSYNP